MRIERLRRSWALGVLLLVAVAVSSELRAAPTAEGFEPAWRIRFYAASIDFDSTDGYRAGTRPGYDIDIGFGFGFNAEYRFSRRLGVDLGILGGAAVDVAWRPIEAGEWVWTGYDTLSFTPLSAGLDIHLTPDKSVDLYVCPMLAWVHYGGLVIHSEGDWTATTVHFEEDLSLGLALGMGVPIGEREKWSFAASLSYLESGLESDSWGGRRLTGDYDATMLGLGFGYRFGGQGAR